MNAKFRYDTGAQWFKGNTHIHTTASDGGTAREDVAAMYAGAGYRFLFCTDHWVCSDLAARAVPSPLLWLDGIELDGQDTEGSWFHVVCLGRVRGIDPKMGLTGAMRAARQQGALLVLAHPHWCGNSIDDALRCDFDGVEVYNHVCRWLNGKSDGAVYWDAMLRRLPNTLAFASDDAHLRPEHPGWNGGWIKVNAAACSREAILAAIRRGNYFSSCGPDFLSIVRDGARIVVRTSPVRFMRLVGPGCVGERLGRFEGEEMTEGVFAAPIDWPYARLEIEDDRGRRAWTNALFVEEEPPASPAA